MTRTGWICWVALAAAWVGVVAYLIGHREQPLCPPADPVVVRLGQTSGTKEPGVVYLGFRQALAARDGLDAWLHQHGECP